MKNKVAHTTAEMRAASRISKRQLRPHWKAVRKLIANLAVLSGCGLVVGSTFLENPNRRPSNDEDRSQSLSDHLPVSVELVARERVEITETYVGTFHPFREYRLSMQVDGQIVGLNATDEEPELDEGDFVRQGQTLIRLDETEALANLRELHVQEKLARDKLARSRRMLERNKQAVSEQEIRQIESNLELARIRVARTKKAYRDLRLKSPANGVISKRLSHAGSVVAAHETVLELLDVSTLLLEIGVPESRIQHIETGQTVNVQVLNHGTESPFQLMGHVYRVGQSAHEETGLFRVQVRVPNWITVLDTTEGSRIAGVGGNVNAGRLSINLSGVTTAHLDLELAQVDRNSSLEIFVLETQDAMAQEHKIFLKAPIPESITITKTMKDWRIGEREPIAVESRFLPASRLRPGQIARGRFIISNRMGYKLHVDCLVRRDGHQGVFMVAADQLARFVALPHWTEHGPWAVVSELDTAARQVVVRGQHRLNPDSPVRIVALPYLNKNTPEVAANQLTMQAAHVGNEQEAELQ